MNSLERLEQLLDDRDAEISEAREKVMQLERELDGARDGWRRMSELDDDGVLPVPRLEMAYIQDDEWRSYRVSYRMVHRHLLGQLLATPLGLTRVNGSGNYEPDDLPFRDGKHAQHDAAHLQMPLYKVMPGKPPERVEPNAETASRGRAHRRMP